MLWIVSPLRHTLLRSTLIPIPFRKEDAAMETAMTCNDEHALEGVLYMASELDNNPWLQGRLLDCTFSEHLGQK